MIKCRDGTLYTGVTNDLERRIGDHDRGRGCRYTRGRGPVKLIYRESCRSSSLALRREARIKGLSRVEKMLLIGSPLHFSAMTADVIFSGSSRQRGHRRKG